MDVGVDKSGQDDLPGQVILHLAAVGTHPYDEPLRHGDIPLADLVGKHVDIGGVFKHQVRLLPSGGHVHDPQLFVDLPGDLPGVALLMIVHGTPSFPLMILSVRIPQTAQKVKENFCRSIRFLQYIYIYIRGSALTAAYACG